MTTTPNPDANVNGTSRQGRIDISYDEIVAKLGKPHDIYMEKTDAEWFFDTPDGVATLYNYKSWIGTRDWHIGGRTPDVVKHVAAYLGVEPQ